MNTRLSDVPQALHSDFDIVSDPTLLRDPHERLMEVLVNDPRDIVFTPHNGGHWIVSNYQYGCEILKNSKDFGSFPIGVPANFQQRPRLIPLESDPTDHLRYRRLLLPVFEPSTVSKMTGSIKSRTKEVMDSAFVSDNIDFLWDIAKPIPTGVFLDMMGLSQEMQPQFFEWENGFYRAPTVEERIEFGQKIALYLSQSVEDHVANPRDDIVSLLLAVEVEGERLTRSEVDAICYLLFLAGVDTVATMLGFIFRYLAGHQELYRHLQDHPEKLQDAVDELIRMHAFINLNRICESDIVFHGVSFRKGDNIVIPSFVTDRDSRFFMEPDHFNLERPKKERIMHHAFGDGPHKCIGMHLAKLEVRTVLAEFLQRVSWFEISDPKGVTAHGGTTMGLDALPIRIRKIK